LYHIGSQEVTPVAVPEEPEEQPKEEEVPGADEEVGEDLPECPDHCPSSFERGKPRSIFHSQFPTRETRYIAAIVSTAFILR
jgi:hypothetical protein